MTAPSAGQAWRTPASKQAYGVAVAAVAAATIARWLLDPVLGDRFPFVTYFLAVVVAAWYGGIRPALLATGLGMLLVGVLFLPPHYSLWVEAPSDRVGLFVFAAMGVAVAGFSGALHDALRRCQAAELETAEHAERLRTTLASIGDGVIATDSAGRVTNMNAVAEQLTGWSNAEARGQPLETVFHIVNEETRAAVENPAARALASGVIVGLANHTLLIAKDGVERPIDDSAAPIRCKDGEIVGCVLVFRDVAERRRMEKEMASRLHAARSLAAIVESTDDAIISKSLDGVIRQWNAGAERMFGYTAAEAIGRPITLLIPPDRIDEEDRIIAQLKAGQRIDHYDTLRRRKDGQLIHVSLTISPLRDETGQVVGASKIARDVTERRQMEERLRKLAADLSEADRRKDEFLATLAHELRNPLAPIRNALQVIRLSTDPAVVENARAMMDRQLDQMVRLVDDLLDVSRITRGKLELRREPVEIAAVIRSALETSRPLIDAMGHDLTVVLPEQPVLVDADPTRLAQVVANLLNNSAKYTERGGTIRLSADMNNGDVVVSVKDTGVGIAPQHLPRIFDMFSQVDGSLERSQGGLGIGLTLVKRLVELHGGAVEARSEGPGRGAEFLVRLPVIVEPRERPSGGRSDPHAAKSSHRILIVDDNRDGANSLATLLRLMGNEVCMAYDGLEGVALADQFQPEVVLLDIGLPKLNGYEACQRMRQADWGRNALLVAVTGWGQDEDRRRSKEAGFDYHLTKPVSPPELMRLLADLQESNVR